MRKIHNMAISTIIMTFFLLNGCTLSTEIKVCDTNPDLDLSKQMSDFPIVVNLKSTFTPGDITQANEAIQEWNNEVGAEVFVLNTNPNLIKDGCGYVDVTYENILSGKTLGRAFYNDCSGKIVLYKKHPSIHSFFKETLMHELGHTIGLEHENKDPLSIMYKNINNHNQRLSDTSVQHVLVVMNCFQQNQIEN